MEHQTFQFFAAGAEYNIPGTDEYQFKFVRPAAGKSLPYLTKNKNGLRTTRHHAGLYEINLVTKTATLVQSSYMSETRCPQKVQLTDDMLSEINAALSKNEFYK